jgi:hypothetical protein
MENTYWTQYYRSLEGATILKFNGMTKDDPSDWGDGFPTFTVRFADGSVDQIQISQDPEGNGGGFVFGLVVPEQVNA